MKFRASLLLVLVDLTLVLALFSVAAHASEVTPMFTGRTGHLIMPLTGVNEQPGNYYRVEMSCNLFTYDCHIDSIIHVCDGFSPAMPACAFAKKIVELN
jgi:hypothetical protein